MESEPPPNKYQIAGIDDRDRGFNRQVEIRRQDSHYHAVFRYEQFLLQAEPKPTEQTALLTLISQLHQRGYTQLRSRLHFRGEQYLGNQEMWDEHPDPQTGNPFQRFLDMIAQMWRNTR